MGTKQKIVHGRGPFKINIGMFVFPLKFEGFKTISFN